LERLPIRLQIRHKITQEKLKGNAISVIGVTSARIMTPADDGGIVYIKLYDLLSFLLIFICGKLI